MDNLIKREDAIDKIYEVYEYEFPTASGAFDEFVTMIIPNILRNLPSAELKERTTKVGNQIFNNSNPHTVGAWIGTCECGELVSYSSKYCHMCGAKLDWSGNE